jgi:cardiolipin synthase
MLRREQLAKIAIAAGEVPPLRAEAVDVFCDGESKYRAIGDAIAAARRHVHVEYYIWEPDRIGTRLRDQLVAKAREGVEVRVIVDGTGSFGLRKGFLDPITAAGGEIAWFNPVSLLRLRRKRADFRTHRKIVVCDGTVGFTGGMNVADAHSAEFVGDAAWRDTHLRIAGSAVRALQRIFVEDWLDCSGKQLPFDDAYFPQPAGAAGEVVQIVASGPDTAAFAVHKMFFAAINQAVERIWLTTPYFVPDDPILNALICAAMRGVDVQLIVPERGDSRLVDLAARSYFPEVLAAGVRVFEYRDRFVHAKTFVIDDDVAIVGTANLDNRSFRLNFEVAAVVYGGAINAQLDQAFRRDLESCRELFASFWDRQKLLPRLGQSGARLLSPLL